MHARDQSFGLVALASFIFITAMVLQEELGDESGELREEIGALRVEIECRNQPDDRDVGRLLAELQRDR